MKHQKIINNTTLVSILLISVTIIGFVLIFGQLIFNDNKPENFGVVGDAVGGILNPIIAIAGALLTFLAFYIQKLANDDIKNQFREQQEGDHKDFLFKNYKDRILLIINEINNFNISFHGSTLISEISDLKDPYSKKYNFIGIQAINLFLVEYFRLKERKFESGEVKLVIEDSYHAILLHINNLITAYYKLHIEVQNCELEEKFKTELFELLNYTYYSKFNYFLEYLYQKHLHSTTEGQIKYLLEYYKSKVVQN